MTNETQMQDISAEDFVHTILQSAILNRGFVGYEWFVEETKKRDSQLMSAKDIEIEALKEERASMHEELDEGMGWK